MVKPADVPEYLTHNTSKRHSPTVAPSVAAPGPLVFRELMRFEMESAQVLMGWGASSSIEFELVDILLEKMKLNVCPFFEKKINFILLSEKKNIAPLVL
jgi:hypothetical protein